MYFKTSNEAIIKIKEEIEKKGFFAFDILENNFLSPDLKIYLRSRIMIILNISNKKLSIIFLIINFIYFFIYAILKYQNIESLYIPKYFLLTSFIIYLIFVIFNPVINIFLDFIFKNYLEKIEKIKRMVFVFNKKIYILNKEIEILELNNLENYIWEGYKKQNLFDNLFTKGNYFRKIFFETEEKIDRINFHSALLKKNLNSLEFGEQNFSNFSRNIEKINILIKKIFKNIEKIQKIKNLNFKKLEIYLKEKIIFSLDFTKNILEKNLDFINILLEKNKNYKNNQIILANKRLELQKNSILNHINFIDERIKKL